MISFSSLLILSLFICKVGSSDFRKNCREALHRGRNVIESTAHALVQEESSRLRRKVTERMREMQTAKVLFPNSLVFTKYMSKSDADDGPGTTLPPCPEPNRTMFTTLAPPTTTTIITTSGVTSCSSTAVPTTVGQMSTTSGTTGTVTKTEAPPLGTTSTNGVTTLPVTSEATQTSTATSQTGTSGIIGTTATTEPRESVGTTGITGTTGTTGTSGPTGTTGTTGTTVTTTATAQPITTSKMAIPTNGKVNFAESDQMTTSGEVSTAASSSEAGNTVTTISSQTTAGSSAGCSAGISTEGSAGFVQDSVRGFKKPFRIPTMYSQALELDPFHKWMSTIYSYMFKEEEICDQPLLKDLNSITEDQLYGFLSTLAAANPGPFCSLCDRFMSEIRRRVFIVNPLWGEDGQHIMRLLYANIPTSKSFCSTLAPACYNNYAEKTRNITQATICLECTACMTAGNVIQHNLLLDKEMVGGLLAFLRSSLFHNTCAELCLVWQPMNLTLFPNGFTYEGCMNFLTDGYQEVIDIATVLLRPERFCSLELQWCELNEVPNVIHCLYELCIESLKDTPQAAWLCSLIPDNPDTANQFLNIQMKRPKAWKSYHEKFIREKIQHDDL